MTLVTELDLPAFDYTAPDFSADRYHELGGVEGIYGVDALPLRWAAAA